MNKELVGLGNVDNTNDANKPISTATQAALASKADLVAGKVPASQLPSYVDDVEEYATLAGFPATGETGKIYVDLSTGRIYRWSGSTYAEISASLALGETSSTAYRGDRGKAAFDHSQITSGNPHGVTAATISDFNSAARTASGQSFLLQHRDRRRHPVTLAKLVSSQTPIASTEQPAPRLVTGR